MSRALPVGVFIAIACLAYVLYPLVGRGRGAVTSRWTRAAQRLVTDDEIEAAIRSYRASRGTGPACAVCGPRPEANAVFCSNCGRRLEPAGAMP